MESLRSIPTHSVGRSKQKSIEGHSSQNSLILKTSSGGKNSMLHKRSYSIVPKVEASSSGRLGENNLERYSHPNHTGQTKVGLGSKIHDRRVSAALDYSKTNNTSAALNKI